MAAPAVTCPINGLGSRPYCNKGAATYYIEPSSGTIFQVNIPSVAEMHVYADQEYAGGHYKEYAKSGNLKIATAQEKFGSIRSAS